MSPESTDTKEVIVQGVAASPGIAYGQVFVYAKSDVEVPSYKVDPGKREEEIARFERALLLTRQQIAGIQSRVEGNAGAEEARIFDAHLLVLEDQALIGETIRDFEKTGDNIETCFNRVSQHYVQAFDEIDDEYLRERAGDIRDVTQRVLQCLVGQAAASLNQLAAKRIIVATDISPSDSASIDRKAVLAMVTDTGSRTSHAVIVARSMKVPANVGLHDLTKRAQNGQWALVDGYDGVVILNPSEATLLRYGQIRAEKATLEERLIEANRQPAVTLDGVRIKLMANIERVDEIEQVKEYNAEGVGLFRTEYLYLNSQRIPSEAEQREAYRTVVSALAPHPVVIRTLDLGGDKPMAGNPDLFPKENNPFMGFRAIRFCLEHQDLFRAQLRAILAASAYGKVQLMYPMISGVEELTQANALLESCKQELQAQGVAFDAGLAVGAMIEIPSAAMTSDILAEECDFFSLGTNDLIQYLLAIDRVNDRIAHLYEPAHPAVLRTLRHVIEEAHKQQITVSVCGEMAADPVLVPLLLGLGVDALSMAPPLLPAVRYLVRAIKMEDAKKLALESLAMKDAKAIHRRCDDFYGDSMRLG